MQLIMPSPLRCYARTRVPGYFLFFIRSFRFLYLYPYFSRQCVNSRENIQTIYLSSIIKVNMSDAAYFMC